jgi:hypothetical protein
MKTPTFRRSLLAIALLAAATTSTAPASAKPVARQPAQLPADLLMRQDAAASPDSKGAATPLGTDLTPPTLTAFDLPVSLDVGTAGDDARITFSADDEGSGVFNGSATLVGPDGKTTMSIHFGNDVPTRHVHKGRGRLEGSPWAVPGTWTLQTVAIDDYLGNGMHYDTAELAALGIATTTTVVNRKGGDGVAPTLASGHLRDTTYSRSSTQPGTDGAPAYFVVDVRMQDTGNGQVSGVRLAQLVFCTDDESHCMNVISTDNQASGTKAATVQAWQIPGMLGWVVPGLYHLRDVILFDRAGNRNWMTSTFFGGATDFGPLFDTGTDLLVTP